jgi:hypothetical protein
MKMIAEYKGYKIFHMTAEHDPKAFYAEMGHIFASREIRKELDGYPVENEPGRKWVVVYYGDEVVGFRSYDVNEKGEGVYYDAWVREDCRKNGLYRQMLDLAESELKKSFGVSVIKAIGNSTSAPILKKKGFHTVKMRGKFHVMEKVLK